MTDFNDDLLELPSDEESSAHGIGSWIISYGDLMTVLVVFFLIMLSPQAVLSEAQDKKKSNLKEALETIEEISKEEKFDKFIEIEQKGNKGKIVLTDQLLFKSGKADIENRQKEILKKIVGSLKPLNGSHMFSIMGHTDSVKINSAEFPSNWYLSTARALTILDTFIELEFNQKNISAQGFGEFQPIVEEYDKNGSLIEENKAKNRRVEINIQ